MLKLVIKDKIMENNNCKIKHVAEMKYRQISDKYLCENRKQLLKNFLKKLLTEQTSSDKIRKSLEGDKIKWSLKIEQNIVNIKPAILLSLIKTQSNLSKTD